MKKAVCVVLCIVFLFTSMSVAATAVGGVNVSIGNQRAEAGGTLKVPIQLSNNVGVMGFKLIVKYNSAALTPVSVEYGEAMNYGMQDNIEGDSVPGEMCIYWSGSENVSANGVWFNMNFNVNADFVGDTEIELSYSQADTFNEDFEDVLFNCYGGTVSVVNSAYSGQASFSLICPNFSAGEDFTVAVRANTLTSVSPIVLTVSYDSKVFKYIKTEAKGIKAATVDNDGTLTVTITGAKAEYADTNILILHFSSSENTVGGEYGMIATATANGKPVYCESCSFNIAGGAQSGSVIYGNDFYALPGDTVAVPIYISNNTGIMGFRLNFTYNSAVLTPVSVAKGDVIMSGTLNDTIGASEGNVVSVVWNSTSETKENGELLVMTFTVNGDAEYSTADIGISFSQEDTFNENYDDVKLICKAVDGAITNLVPISPEKTTVKPDEGYVYSDITACSNINQLLNIRGGYTLGGTPNSLGYYGTGSTAFAKNGSNTVESYKIVITADVNGDSASDVLDAAAVALVANGFYDLTGVALAAGDFNGNEIIDIGDYQSIVNYIVA